MLCFLSPDHRTENANLAKKPNYNFEKNRREQEKKKKKEEKRLRKLEARQREEPALDLQDARSAPPAG